ncbi:Holliday junction ATP-dependent DNA helicase RuvA [Bacteroidota bacterium]|nr:Holliday junction ATP-dependent DNA helicase RuvA [Bacteroidota bacterium]
MISYLQGKFSFKSPTHIIIENGGVGYHVNISMNTWSKIQHDDSGKLHTYLHITGGTQSPLIVSLYGFAEEEERSMFTELLNISGVGASTVRMVLSALSPNDLRNAILTENAHAFERIKGIGPKTAKRIILELKDKVAKVVTKADGFSPHNKVNDEALSALIMLGFSRAPAEHAVQRVVASNPSMTVEDIIKQVLKTI